MCALRGIEKPYHFAKEAIVNDSFLFLQKLAEVVCFFTDQRHCLSIGHGTNDTAAVRW